MPTLQRIHDKVLNLCGYKMNPGLCRALGKSFYLYNNVLEKLLLESTGTDDDMLSHMLEGLQEQSNFKAFTYKFNVLGEKSVRQIVKLITREMPFNLDELRVINCKISPYATQMLLEDVPDTSLRRLSLVKTQMNSQMFRMILDLI